MLFFCGEEKKLFRIQSLGGVRRNGSKKKPHGGKMRIEIFFMEIEDACNFLDDEKRECFMMVDFVQVACCFGTGEHAICGTISLINSNLI